MVGHHPAKFDDNHFGSGDTTFSVVEGQDFRSPHFNPPLLFTSKAHGMPCSHTKFQDVDTVINRCVQ